MADSAVAVTAGTGTNVDTRTESTNGNHRQVVVLGDPATNAGVAPVDATAGLKVDLGADNDITGTVTANLSATDNAVLDSIDADLTTLIGHADGVEGLLTTIDADTGSIATDASTLAGAVSGTEMQVDIVSAPTITVDLGANNDVTTELTTADLDTGAGTDTRAVVGLVGSASGGGELLPGSATDGLLVNLGSNNDISGTVTANLSATDNAVLDAIQTATEATQAAVEGTLTVTGGGGGTEYTVNAVAPTDPTGSTFVMERDDALASLTEIEGDWTNPRSTAEGALWTQDFNSDAILADTANMDTNLGTIAGAVSGTEMQVDVLSSALPTGAATSANQSTIIGHVDGIEGLLTTIDADTSSLAGTVSGTEMQIDVVGSLPAGDNNIGNVDIASSLPAGTNAIGKLSANSGVDIGDVDVTSIAAGTNLVGDVGIQGRATGGLSTYYDSDLDETAIAVKASAGTIYAIEAFNTTAAPLFLQLFNVAQGSVTVGTTTPTNQWVIPGNADSDGAGFTFNVPQGIAYGTAITAACSTNSEGNTAPGVGACIVNIHYK